MSLNLVFIEILLSKWREICHTSLLKMVKMTLPGPPFGENVIGGGPYAQIDPQRHDFALLLLQRRLRRTQNVFDFDHRRPEAGFVQFLGLFGPVAQRQLQGNPKR